MSISATLRRVLTFFSIDREDEVEAGARWTPLMESRFMQLHPVHMICLQFAMTIVIIR